MEDSTVKWIVGGVVGLYVLSLLSRLFGDSAADKASSAGAMAFDDPDAMPELYGNAAAILSGALANGTITPAQFAASKGRLSTIAKAVVNYHDAKGLLKDTEDQAVAAIGSLVSWCDLLTFAGTFRMNYNTAPGPYGHTYLSDQSKAAIVKLILNIRKK